MAVTGGNAADKDAERADASNSLPILPRTLSLRRFVPEDAAKVFAMSLEAGYRKWLPDQVWADQQTALRILEYLIASYDDPGDPAKGPYVLGICLTETGELIGHVGLSPLGEAVEIGYAIEEKHQGRGYARLAVRAATEWGLTEFGLKGVLGVVAKENVSSCRVLEAAGYSLIKEEEGRIHHWKGLVRTYRRETDNGGA